MTCSAVQHMPESARETVKQVRASEKMGVKIMQKWEELAYARQDGLEEGRMQTLTIQTCKKLAFAPLYDSAEVYQRISDAEKASETVPHEGG